MAEKLASNRNKVASSPAAGIAVVNAHDWVVEASANGDTVVIGELPAYHRLVPELCSFTVDAAAPAMNVDVCVDDGTNPIFDNVAVVGGAFARTALTAFAAVAAKGVSQVNRKIYLLLNTAPATAGGKVTVQIGSAPSS